jgi:hypothetical protein
MMIRKSLKIIENDFALARASLSRRDVGNQAADWAGRSEEIASIL